MVNVLRRLACALALFVLLPAAAHAQRLMIVPTGCVPPPSNACLPTFFISRIGEPHTVLVAAVDNAGNLDTAYRGRVAITTEDAYAVLPAPHTFTAADGGLHAFTVTFATRTTTPGPLPQTYWTRVTATDDSGRTNDDFVLLPGSAPLVPPIEVPAAGSRELALLGLLLGCFGAGVLLRRRCGREPIGA